MRRRAAALLAGVTCAAVAGAGLALASWTMPASSGTGAASAAPDFRVPVVTTAVVVPAGVTGAGGYLSPGVQFSVYANVADTGNPPSGVASVTANLSTLSAGSTAVPLTPCSSNCTVGAVTYGYVSSAVTADNSLTAGAKTFTVDAVDNAGNDSGPLSKPATVQTAVPSVTASTVASTATSAPGWVAQGGSYAVYANITDASGVSSLTADLSSITGGDTAVSLTHCSSGCTIGGVSYGYKSAAQVAGTPLTEGAAVLSYSISVLDNAGLQASHSGYSVSVDNTAGSITAGVIATSSPSTAGWVKQGGSYRIYATGSDALSGVSTVTANVSGVTSGQTAVNLPACTSSCTVGGVTYGYKSAALTASTPLAEGSVGFVLTLTDKAGNGTSQGYSVTVDDTPATVTVSVIAPTTTNAAGWLGQGAAYRVYANATDAGSGVSTLTADVSSITSGTTALALPACTSSCTVNGVTYAYKSGSKTASTPLTEGPLSYSVTGLDKANNTATTPGFSVTIDDTAAVATQSVIANTTTGAVGWVKKSGTYNVYANATDTAAGVASVTANVSSITSGQTALALTACTTSCTVGGVTYAYKSASKTASSTLAEGTVSYTVSPTDAAGNTAATSGFSVHVDDTVPTGVTGVIANTLTGVGGYLRQGGTYNVYANAADGGSGLNAVTASVSTVTTGQTAVPLPACTSACNVNGVSYAFKSATLTANASLSGSKTLTVTAQDIAANSASSSGLTVTIDNTVPTVSITFPLATYSSGWTAGCSTPAVDDICGSAGDASSGVNQVQASVRQAAAPNSYWNPATPGFSSATEILLSTSFASPTWTLGFAGSNLAAGAQYTIRALATDNAGNTATTSTTFTFNP
jgi:hypothetical protein